MSKSRAQPKHTPPSGRVLLALGAAALAVVGVAGCSKSKEKPEGVAVDGAHAADAGPKISNANPLRPRAPSKALRLPPIDPRYQPVPKATAPLAPPSDSDPVVELPVGAGWQAHVAVPVGAKQQRPVLLVLTEQVEPVYCGQWAGAAKAGAFTICINRIAKPNPEKSAAKAKAPTPVAAWGVTTRAALKAAKERYSEHLASGSVVMVAYGPAETIAVELARESPKFFSRLVLVGPGDPGWDAALADHFAVQGGQRVVFLCEGEACGNHAVRGASWLRTTGVASRVVPLANANLGKELGWLVAGDPRWAFLKPEH
jgi:hypothetical protein